MCGITGIYSNSHDLSVIGSMTQSLRKRGPDGSGILLAGAKDKKSESTYFKSDENINLKKTFSKFSLALGHTRLAIIDTSNRGLQPMHCPERRYWIVYNGEIYNYIELRGELLRAGYTFKTKSDTEVVMNAYDYWGKDCMHKFNGMWAFCIFDSLKNRLFISRDRFGEKPLYFSKGDDFFVFGSEIKSIFASGVIKARVKRDKVDEYINSGPIEYEKTTFFEKILRLPPAHYLEIDLNKKTPTVQPIKYYYLKVNTSTESFDENKAISYSKQYYALLKDSVRLRIRADVPIGSALSGGLDSSSIVYLINELNRENKLDFGQKTFSCVYKNDENTAYCDESEYIELLSKQLNIRNYQITPLVEQIPSEHFRMIESFESPPENTCMSGWWTYKLVQNKKIKVTLDGQGADEQLTGYLYYYAFFLYGLSLRDFSREIFYCIRVPGALPYVWRGAIAFIIRCFLGSRLSSILINKISGRAVPKNLNEQLYNDFTKGLVNLFNNADRASMAHSIESRLPYVDYRLVEFLSSVPACYKIHNGWSKYLARLAFSNKLPDEICWRRDKMGWPIPEDVWFNGELGPWITEQCSRIRKATKIQNELKYSDKTKKLMLRCLNLNVVDKIFKIKII